MRCSSSRTSPCMRCAGAIPPSAGAPLRSWRATGASRGSRRPRRRRAASRRAWPRRSRCRAARASSFARESPRRRWRPTASSSPRPSRSARASSRPPPAAAPLTFGEPTRRGPRRSCGCAPRSLRPRGCRCGSGRGRLRSSPRMPRGARIPSSSSAIPGDSWRRCRSPLRSRPQPRRKSSWAGGLRRSAG